MGEIDTETQAEKCIDCYNRICTILTFSAELYCPIFIYFLCLMLYFILFFNFFFFFKSSKLFRHLCLPLPLSSPLFRGYVKRLRRPGCVGCRTEEVLTTFPTSIHQEGSSLGSLSHPFSATCHGSALFRRHTNSFTPNGASALQPLWSCGHDEVIGALSISIFCCCCISLLKAFGGVFMSAQLNVSVMSAMWLCLNHAA